jgi:hydroxylamine reductase
MNVQAATPAPNPSATQVAPAMGCYQCEQRNDHGCSVVGVCGKTPEVAAMQDLLVAVLKGVSMYAHRAAQLGRRDEAIDIFVMRVMFSTLTNVNFDEARFVDFVREGVAMREKAKAMYEAACRDAGRTPEANLSAHAVASWNRAGGDLAALLTEAKQFSLWGRQEQFGKDIVGLQELITYGIKGLCAYGEHAERLGEKDAKVFAFMHEALDFVSGSNARAMDANECLGMALKVGEANYRVLEMLDHAHVTRFGHPEPTAVPITPRVGKAIIVSGHDIGDLLDILKATQGTGINVYTHGELLPAGAYPAIKAFPHFAGNYGSAWQNQKIEFSQAPAAIVMTTNCIVEPRPAYRNRIFTKNVVGYKGVRHLAADTDYSEVIEMARSLPGFTKEEPRKTITIGLARNAVMGVADKIIGAVKQGDIKNFYVIGGCDGSESERSYFRDLALALPKDDMILGLGCATYRYNKLDHGTIAGLPRYAALGQCNDAYSAIQIALALKDAFGVQSVNDLPIKYAISWLEQKAVAVLLTMLFLGIKNIHLGPRLPEFLPPSAVQLLNQAFGLKPITTVEQDWGLKVPVPGQQPSA